MHLAESVKRWLIAELTADASVSGLVPAFSVGGVATPDDVPTRSGVFVGLSDTTRPEKFIGFLPVSVSCIQDTEQKAFTLLEAVSRKFALFGGDRFPGWSVDPRGGGYLLRINRVRVDRESPPVMITTSKPDLFLAAVHLSFTCSAV